MTDREHIIMAHFDRYKTCTTDMRLMKKMLSNSKQAGLMDI